LGKRNLRGNILSPEEAKGELFFCLLSPILFIPSSQCAVSDISESQCINMIVKSYCDSSISQSLD